VFVWASSSGRAIFADTSQPTPRSFGCGVAQLGGQALSCFGPTRGPRSSGAPGSLTRLNPRFLRHCSFGCGARRTPTSTTRTGTVTRSWCRCGWPAGTRSSSTSTGSRSTGPTGTSGAGCTRAASCGTGRATTPCTAVRSAATGTVATSFSHSVYRKKRRRHWTDDRWLVTEAEGCSVVVLGCWSWSSKNGLVSIAVRLSLHRAMAQDHFDQDQIFTDSLYKCDNGYTAICLLRCRYVSRVISVAYSVAR